MSDNERIGIIIQARTGATRLPQKTVLPFYNNKGILEILLDKLASANLGVPIIVATTINDEDNQIANIVNERERIELFRGSENNVLNRFIEASQKFDLTKIIRICADNPFLDLDSVVELIERFKRSESDYLGFMIDNTPSIKTHYGFWAEAVKLEALKDAATKTNNTLYLEHVTNFIYGNESIYNVDFLSVKTDLSKDIRLTLDSKEDFQLQQKVFAELSRTYNSISFSMKNILDYLDDHKELLDTMRQQINKYTK